MILPFIKNTSVHVKVPLISRLGPQSKDHENDPLVGKRKYLLFRLSFVYGEGLTLRLWRELLPFHWFYDFLCCDRLGKW